MNNKARYYKEEIEKFGLAEDKIALSLLWAIVLRPEDQKAQERLESYIKQQPQVRKKLAFGSPFSVPSLQDAKSGDIRIGTDEYGNPFFLNAYELVKHLGVGAASGFCKTSLIKILQCGLFRLGISFFACDYKNDSPELLPDVKMVVLRASHDSNFCINPLQQLPGVDIATQDTTFVQCLSEACSLQDGSQFLLLSHLKKLRQSHSFPTVLELLESVKNDEHTNRRFADWKVSSLRSLESLVRLFHKMLLCRKGIDLIDLVSNNNVVLLLDNAGEFRTFWPILFLSYYLKWKMSANLKDERAKLHINFCDEGNLLFSRQIQKDSVAKIPLLLSILQLCRQYREGIVISSNHVRELSDIVIANTAGKAAGFLGDDNDCYIMSRAMGMTPEQANHIKTLKQGEMIVRREGFPSFKVILDYPPQPTYLSKEEVDKLSLPVLQRYELILPQIAAQQKNPQQQEPLLSPDEEAFLKDVALHITATKTSHYQNCAFSMDKGDRTFKKVFAKGLVFELCVNLGGNQKVAKILHLTEKGFAAIKQKPTYQVTRGEGAEHNFWTHYYNEQLQKGGYKTKISHSIKGKEVDVGIIRDDGSVVALEVSISTTAEHEAGQIVRNIEAGYSFVFTLTKDKAKAEKVLSLLKEQGVSPQKFFVTQFVPDVTQILKERSITNA